MSQILGVGTEIVECLRIANLIERHGEQFLRRVYTSNEIAFCSSRAQSTQHYSACWAGKEAVLKAMHLRLSGGVTMRDIEVRLEPDRHTQVLLGGLVRDDATRQRICELQMSTSFCRTFAAAFVVAIKE